MPVAGTVGIADVAVFVFMLLIVAVLWILLQARAPVGGVPLVGSAGVNLIDGMRRTITDLAVAMESFLTWQQSQASALWEGFVKNIMAPALNAIDQAATAEAAFIHNLVTTGLGRLQVQQDATHAVVVGVVVPTLNALQGRVAADEAFSRGVLLGGLTLVQAQLLATQHALSDTQARLQQTEQQLASTMDAVAVLVPYLPALRGLTGFESSTAVGVGVLQRELDQQRGRVQVNTDDIAKVLALSGVAALGAVAVNNLVRVARDPCSACSGTNLLDMETRLELVEAFGET